jgi:hypothetical protein
MLIHQVLRAARTPLVENAFGFGSAKLQSIGVGLFR